jgi:hypothetical protein
VTVSFSKYRPWQTMHFLQLSTHFSAWKKWIGGTPLHHPPYSPDLAPCDFWAFPTMKRSSEARNFEMINGLQHVFEKWVERCKKCVRSASLAKGSSSKMKPSLHLHIVPTRSNKVSPRTFQTALVYVSSYGGKSKRKGTFKKHIYLNIQKRN